jgi:hypothetical protein
LGTIRGEELPGNRRGDESRVPTASAKLRDDGQASTFFRGCENLVQRRATHFGMIARLQERGRIGIERKSGL